MNIDKKREFTERTLTSFILFFIIIFSILAHSYFLLAALIIIFVVSFKEFNLLINRAFETKYRDSKSKWIRNENIRRTIQVLSFLYLSLFAIISWAVIDSDRVYFIYILLICICSDIGGFVFGKTFGGKKLTKISPNKTISGSCGSFIFSVLPFFIFYNFYKNTDYLLYNNILFNISSCLYLSLVCQLGDLFISYFKRLAKVKDTGRVLPGHGGLLDRIDGIVFALPSYLLFGYFYFL